MKKISYITYIYLIISAFFVATIFLAPVFAYFSPNIYNVIFNAWSYNCHQLPSRSPFFFGVQLPVCWRCMAIFLGFFIGAVLVASQKVKIKLWLFVAAMLPMAFDGYTQYLGSRVSTNPLRFSTGLLFGLAATLWLLPFVNRVISKITNFVRKKLKS